MNKIVAFLKTCLEIVIYICTGDTGSYTRPVELPPDIVMDPITPVAPAQDPSANRLALYEWAKGCLHKDIAATQDELGCAEAVSYLLHKVGVPGFKPTVSTQELWGELKALYAFEQVQEPLPGDIIISPTGTSTIAAAHGHVGIVAFYGILSNNSMTGLFEEYYTMQSWKAYYGDKLKFPIYYFRFK